MLQIIHTSDLHIGAPIDTTDLSHAVAGDVRHNALATLRRICADATRLNVAAVIIAGDLFDSPRPAPIFITDTLDIFRATAPIPIIIAPGNHDPRDTCTAWSDFRIPQNVRIFPDAVMRPIEIPGTPLVCWGFAWPTNDLQESPFTGFQLPPTGDRTTNVLIGHGSEIHSQPEHWKRYAPFSYANIKAPYADYIAMGHLHHHATPYPAKVPLLHYPGSPCPASRRDHGPHYYALVTFDEHATRRVLIPTNSIEFNESTFTAFSPRPDRDLKQHLLVHLGKTPARSIANLTITGQPDLDAYNRFPDIVARTRPLFLHLAVTDYTMDPNAYDGIRISHPDFTDHIATLDQFAANAESPEIAAHFQNSRMLALAHFAGNHQEPRKL